MGTLLVRYEQAVYGSFPFWNRGYAMLAQSPGCRPEWLAGFRAACQQYGERPAGVGGTGGIFALRLPRGPWMIVGVGTPGADDHGRPGALAFHALFLSPWTYRRLAGRPFGLAGAFRSDWTEQTQELNAGSLRIAEEGTSTPAVDPRTEAIATALERGWRVVVQADAPIDALAADVWGALTVPIRRRLSMATWAFGNKNRFNLVALPKLPRGAFDETYLDGTALSVGDVPPRPSWWKRFLPTRTSRLASFSR